MVTLRDGNPWDHLLVDCATMYVGPAVLQYVDLGIGNDWKKFRNTNLATTQSRAKIQHRTNEYTGNAKMWTEVFSQIQDMCKGLLLAGGVTQQPCGVDGGGEAAGKQRRGAAAVGIGG